MAGNGGKRLGAGRKPGSKNKRPAQLAIAAGQSGVTMVEILMRIARYWDAKAQDEPDVVTRMAYDQLAGEHAAKAAPYAHARLASIEVSGPNGGPIQHEVTHEERAEQAAELLAFAKRRMAATGSRNGHSN